MSGFDEQNGSGLGRSQGHGLRLNVFVQLKRTSDFRGRWAVVLHDRCPRLFLGTVRPRWLTTRKRALGKPLQTRLSDRAVEFMDSDVLGVSMRKR